MKKKCFFAFIALFCAVFLLLICLAFHAYDSTAPARMKLVLPAAGGQKSVSLFERDGVYYGFLPAYTEGAVLQADPGVNLCIDDVPYTDSTLSAGEEYTLSVRNLWGRETLRVPLVLMQGENIPAISIQLTDGSARELGQAKVCAAYMTVTEPDSTISYQGEVKEFHIRGNYTATLPKTSYAVKFKNGVDLLGTGKDTTYCLMANTDDESKLRNALVYDTARELGLAHSPAFRYADLYIDGVYYGLYMLTERVDVSQNRINLTELQKETEKVNFYSLKHYDPWSSGEGRSTRRAFSIPTDPRDITGGYLLELDSSDRLEEHENTFLTERGLPVSVKYPSRCSVSQLNYIADYFQQIESSVYDGTWTESIDVESWAKYYLVEEFFSQIDVASIYFYKDSDAVDPKLYAGPVWDFDWSFGLGGAFTGKNTYVSPNEFHFNTWGLFQTLWQDERFFSTVAEIYEKEFRPILTGFLPETMDAYQHQIASSHAMDAIRWEGIYVPPYGVHYGSLEGSTAQMLSWTQLRLDCMDQVLLEGTRIIPVTLAVNSPSLDSQTCYFAEGSSPLYLPNGLNWNGYDEDVETLPSEESYTLVGWTDASGRPVDLHAPITEGTVFTAQWVPESNTEEENEPDSRSIFPSNAYTDPIDYFVLLCLAGLALFVLVGVLADFRQGMRQKKRKRHEDRTNVSP